MSELGTTVNLFLYCKETFNSNETLLCMYTLLLIPPVQLFCTVSSEWLSSIVVPIAGIGYE